jgi:hypothetical protein
MSEGVDEQRWNRVVMEESSGGETSKSSKARFIDGSWTESARRTGLQLLVDNGWHRSWLLHCRIPTGSKHYGDRSGYGQTKQDTSL